MLSEGATASTAGFAVGYESPSQFSREYRRLFGAPPRADIARLPDFLVKAPVEEGRLVRLWPAGRTHEVAIHALYPSHRALSAKVRVFIDALAEAAKSHANG